MEENKRSGSPPVDAVVRLIEARIEALREAARNGREIDPIADMRYMENYHRLREAQHLLAEILDL